MIEKILEIDRNLLLTLNFDGGVLLDNIMWYFSWFGSYVILVLIFMMLIKKRYTIPYKEILILFLFVGLVILLCDQTSNFFKNNMPKFRPTHTPIVQDMIHTVRGYVGGLYGTVSGHASNGFGIAMFLSLVYSRRNMTIFAMIYVSLIAYSRIYLGAHYPLDLLFGTMFGLFYGWGVYKLYMKFIKNSITIKK